MSVIDEVLAANEVYSQKHELRHLTPRPARKLALLTCMDTRLSIITMGLKEGDAHIIRNAGGIVTDDAVRSLVISHHLLGTEEIMVINHTDCGLMRTSELDLRTRIQNRMGTAAVAPVPTASATWTKRGRGMSRHRATSPTTWMATRPAGRSVTGPNACRPGRRKAACARSRTRGT